MNRLEKAKRIIALNLAMLLLLTLLPIGALATISGPTFPLDMVTWETQGRQIMVETPGSYTFRVEARSTHLPLGSQWLRVFNAAGTAIAPTSTVHHNDFTSDVTFNLQAGAHTLVSGFDWALPWTYATGATLRLWTGSVEPVTPWVVVTEPAAAVDDIRSGWSWTPNLRPAPGETVQLHAVPARGFEFVNWEVLSGTISLNDVNDPLATFVMPGEDVFVRPVFARMVDTGRVIVSVNNSDWGSAYSSQMAFAGDRIRLGATPSNLWPWETWDNALQDYVNWGHWEVISGDVVISNPSSAKHAYFIMPTPAVDVEVRAVFAFVPMTGISIVPAENFQLGINATRQLAATVVPANATQRVGWGSSDPTVATVSADGLVRGIGVGTATITAGAVNGGVSASLTVTVTMTIPGVGQPPNLQPPIDSQPPNVPPQEPEPPTGGFSDVASGSWYYSYVHSAVENGMMQGVGGGNFAPHASLNRGMLATILWRLAGEPVAGQLRVGEVAVANQPDFGDVAPGRWYSEAIAWAAGEGIVQGVGADRFAPQQNITREQFAVMMFRFAEAMGEDTSVPPGFNLNQFTDADRVQDWAQDAMLWALYHGLITGTSPTTLSPGNGATRAQSAAILARYVEAFAD